MNPANPSPAEPYVQVLEAGRIRRVPLGALPAVVGRQAGPCAIVLEDNLASRQHCAIERTPAGYQLRDLASRNGTRLNGSPVTQPTPLHTGDLIKIGSAVLTFFDPAAPTPAPSADDDLLTEADLAVPASPRFTGDDDRLAVVRDDAPSPPPPPADLIPGFDLIDTAPAATSGPFVSPDSAAAADPEAALSRLADALPTAGVREHEIGLLNARGQLLHAARRAAVAGQRDPVDLFRLLLLVCVRSNATDIHLEPRQDGFHVRLRVDGVMVDVARLTLPVGQKVATLVKVLSDIDISQRNALQEGHFGARVPSSRVQGALRRIDFRVSFAPSVYGQKLVVRILDAESAPLRLADLQLPQWMHDQLQDQILQDSGMVMVAGPTGSGKTTTLYALLRSTDLDRRNAVTIEDPVEIQIDRTTQMPVDEASGKSFSAILRSVLRQDPDIIMVGEIRDSETARTAMQAAITGHMVLSTIHTRDTLGTVFRLLDLGVEPYLVSQGLSIVLAQRLVRALCPACKRPVAPTPAQRAALAAAHADTDRIYTAPGCPRCLGTGHAGRRGVFELLHITDNLRKAIQSRPSTEDLAAAVKDTPYMTLAQSGLRLVADGVASFEEVQRIASR